MTDYKQGDVVLADFPFSEGRSIKRRPAVILSNNYYHQNRQEVIIAAVTTNVKRTLAGDTKIEEWEKAGLLYPSLAAGILQTIKRSMLIKKIGSLSKHDLEKMRENLKKVIEL